MLPLFSLFFLFFNVFHFFLFFLGLRTPLSDVTDFFLFHRLLNFATRGIKKKWETILLSGLGLIAAAAPEISNFCRPFCNPGFFSFSFSKENGWLQSRQQPGLHILLLFFLVLDLHHLQVLLVDDGDAGHVILQIGQEINLQFQFLFWRIKYRFLVAAEPGGGGGRGGGRGVWEPDVLD